MPLEKVSRHVVVTTDASSTGWGATCNGQGPWTLDGALTALAHQLPRAAGSASGLVAVSATAVRQACVGPYGQHCGCVVHQPDGRYTITPHVTARPPSPPPPHREDPRRCTIGVVLSFLQERLERRLSPSTLKGYVAAFTAHHDAVDGRSLGKHDLIVRFLRGARRLNPWDLSIVLAGLQRGPFEPLDLQAFSVSEECLVLGPDYSHVVLRPRPGYVPKVPTTPFRDQVVNLQALPSEEADPALALCVP